MASDVRTDRKSKERRVFGALLRAAMAGQSLPESVVASAIDDVEVLLEGLPSLTRLAVRCGLRVIERGAALLPPDAQPFSMRDVESATAFLGWWDRRPPLVLRRVVMLTRDLVVMALYDRPEMWQQLGYDPDAWIAETSQRRSQRWAREIAERRRLIVTPAPLPAAERLSGLNALRAGSIRPATEMTEDVEVDVVVVGSGAGGAVVAAELAEAGLSVAVLEEGENHRTEEFTTSTLDMLRVLYRDCGATLTLGRVPIQYSEGRGVGGSTVVNGGMAFRASERTLDRWARESGLKFDLDAEYARVERFLSVGPPDASSIGRDQDLLKAGAERLGWKVVPCQRAQVHCSGCNVCTWGCPTGAKQSTLVSYIPRAVAFGADVWTGCRVRRVLREGKAAVGVLAETADGHSLRVRARAVVVAAGAVQTPALLQRSGFRTPSRQVGRNLTLHPGAGLVAVFDDDVQGWRGAHQSYQVREFEADGIILAAVNLPPSLVTRMLRIRGQGFVDEMADYRRMVTAGVLVEDTGAGRVRALGTGQVAVSYPVTPLDAHRIVGALSRLSEAMFAAGARRVHLPIDGLDVVSDLGRLRAITEDPIAAERLDLTTVHLMGTARMGADPLSAVCDPYGAVHDSRGLYVSDASLFPGPVGVNPQLTVMALATRVAAGIIDAW